MFRRKLESLNYFDLESFNIQDEYHFKKLIYWLENEKIRHYKIEERTGLKNYESVEWFKFYNQYLRDIQCQHDPKNYVLVVDWCLTFALRLEYEEKLSFNQSKINYSNKFPKNKNPFDNLDLNSYYFKKKILNLTEKLKICSNQDIFITLKAILISIEKLIIEKNKEFTKKEIDFDLNEIPSGFNISNFELNKICKLLRLLYINDLRKVQTNINRILVQVQSKTSYPKIDTKLGKVGV